MLCNLEKHDFTIEPFIPPHKQICYRDRGDLNCIYFIAMFGSISELNSAGQNCFFFNVRRRSAGPVSSRQGQRIGSDRRYFLIRCFFGWLACVASVSVGFGSKERPRNGCFRVLPARKMGREPKKERWG